MILITASSFLSHCQQMVVVLVRCAGFHNLFSQLYKPLFTFFILNQYLPNILFICSMFYLQYEGLGDGNT